MIGETAAVGWVAIVVACWVGPPDASCGKFEDTRGPYDTFEECVARVEEMVPDINKLLVMMGRVPTQAEGGCRPPGSI